MKIPPFRDSHIHFTFDGRTASAEELDSVRDSLLRNGILQVADRGHRSGIGLEIRDRWKGPITVTSAGRALYRSGGYGSFIGTAVSGSDEIIRAVDAAAAAGSDCIKAVNSGIVLSQGGEQVSPGGFEPDELKLLVHSAREKGLTVVCHANGDRAVRDAVEAGVVSIEHGFFVSRETLDMMAEGKVAWTPTAGALLSITQFIPGHERPCIEDVVRCHCEKIGYAASAGVTLNIGTDAGSKGIAHGDSFFAELRLFRRAGLSLAQILAAACMAEEEIGKGNYLLVTEDFIEKGSIESIHYAAQKEEGTCPT